MANLTIGTSTTIPVDEEEERYKSIISISVVTGIIVITAVSIWVVWLKCCKSPRSKHGVEKSEAKANGSAKKSEYYDQFNVNDNQLTVNSVTAIKWDEDEKKSSRSKSSGIDCDSNSADSKEVRRVQSGKRVFSVNKVPERQRNATSPGSGPVVVKLPKHLTSVARSLQAADMTNFTLALVDKHSNTIHNLDLRNYRKKRAVSPVSADTQSGRIYYSPRRGRHRSAEHSRHKSGAQSASEMLHDSPDLSHRVKDKPSAVSDIETNMKSHRSSMSIESATDASSTSRNSKSLSSHDETDSTSLLPPVSKIPDTNSVVVIGDVHVDTGEQQRLLS